MPDRRLLFLAHSYPPSGGGGVQRPTKFVKYLHRAGWRVTVVTTQPSLYREVLGVYDPSLLSDLPPDLDLRRIESRERPSEPPRGLLAPQRLAFERWMASHAPERVGRGWPEPARTLRRWWWVRRAADPSAAWAEEVVRRLAADGERWPIILATASPYSSLLAARVLARRWQVPFLADLRDPWCVGCGAISIGLFGHRRLESAVLRDAARTVVVTTRMRDDYARAYPEAAPRIVVIENGVDLDEPCRREPAVLRADRFEVVHTGILTEPLSPETFFRAAGMACRRSPDLAACLRIVMIGKIGSTEFLTRRHRAAAAEAGLSDRLEEPGYLPHDEVVRRQRSAGVLLSIVRGGTHIASGKSYEYVGAGRPVLALVDPDGAAMDVLRLAPVALFPPPDDPDAIAAALLELFARWRTGEFAGLAARVPEHVTREFQARQLDRLLLSVLGAGR